MTQTYKKAIVFKSPKIEEHEVQTPRIGKQEEQTPIENKVDKSLGDLKYITNPRYFEEIYTLKKAKQKLYSSDIYGF